MGSKTTGQTNSSQTYTPPPQVLANYTQVTNQAQNVAATPYQAYGGPLVAGINNQQNTGIANVNTAATVQNPYNAGATGLAAASSGAIDPTQYSAQQLQQYENPYQNDVINATEAQINNQNQQQAAALQGNAISAGAFGGDRAGVAQAALAGQQDIANNATLANLNTSNFQNAQNQFTTQQGVNLGAQQNTAARQLAASQQIGNLGAAAQSEGLAGANAQVNAGTLQQATQQAQDTASYNQFLQQQAYPFQTTGWLANIVEGIGSQSGGTTTGQQTTQGGSGLSSVAGGLLGLGSFLKDGGRVNGNQIRIPRKAAGGGLSPYDGTLDPNGVLGGGSWVTPANLAVGHTAPAGMSGSGGAQQSPTQNAMSGMKAMQGLGNAFQNSSLGDSVNDFFQDNFARGGAVRHYDAGGDVSPDALWADADNPHGTGPTLQPETVTPLTAAANLPTPEAAMAARYAAGQMPAPQQDGLTPDQKLAVAMGAPMPPSGDTPPPATPGPVGLVAPDAARDAGLAKLRTAMGSSNTPVDPNAIYGNLDATGVGGVSAPLPPRRPANLDATAVAASPSVDAAAPGGLGAATVGPPTQLPSGGLVTTAPTPAPSAIDGVNPDARGMRNNNPGNLESNAWTQSLPGYVGTDGRFAQFATPQAGSAALDQNLAGYGRKGINTPLQIASTWAPGSEQGNNPSSYGAVIAKTLGVGLNDPVDMSNPATRAKIGQAIAFVENGPGKGSIASAPASQAIAGATGGRGGAQPGLTSGSYSVPGLGGASSYNGAPLTADSPVASTDARPQPDQGGGGLLGLHFSDAARQGMLAAGLGMMGGTSMNPFVNIGQGGLGGLKQYNDFNNLQSEIGLRRAQAERQMVETGLLPAKTAAEIGLQGAQTGLIGAQGAGTQTENQIKAQRLKLLLDATSGLSKEGDKKAEAVAAATSSNAPQGGVLPSTSAGPNAPVVGAPAPSVTSAPATSRPVMAEDDPQKLEARANALALAGETSAAEILTNRANNIREGRRQVSFTDGGPDDYYGNVMQGKNQQVTNAANAAELAKVPAGTLAERQKAQVAAQNQAFEDAKTAQSGVQQATEMRNIMFDPKTGQPTINSGPYGEHIAGLASALQQIGVSPSAVKALTGTDPNNAQALEKLRTTLGSETARIDLGGSQVRVAEWQRILASTPGATLLPQAFKFLIDNVIIPKAQQQMGAYEAVRGLHPEKGDDIQGALYDYNQKSGWATTGRNASAAQGSQPQAADAIPAPAQRTTGHTYMTPKGPMTWVGNGWRPAAASP